MHHFPRIEQFDNFTLGEVLPGGWMKQQMMDDLEHGFAGRLDELTKNASVPIFTDRKSSSSEATKAGMVEDNPRGWWPGETQAVWWDGLLRMAYLTGNVEAMAKADRIMSELLQSQEESGYIGVYSERARYRHTEDNGEFWTQSRAFVAMLAYYELTGKEEYLQAVEKAMALTMREYGPHRTYFGNARPAGGTCHGLMLVDVCEWLFRITGKEAYCSYGIWCYDDYNSTKEVRDTDNQLQHLLLLHEGFVWHTPHTTEHLRVPLWAWFVSGKPQLRTGAENAFDKIGRYLTPSGACIGSESIKNLPPLPDMTYEYCAITELLTSLQSAGQKTGLAEMGDRAEWLAFNAAQGARMADGKAINYMSMDNRHEATLEGNGGRRKFSPTHEDVAVCCNPNAVKLLPYYVSKMWFRLRDGEGICAFCYGPSELRTTVSGVPVTVTEETDYPFTERIVFEVKPARPVEFEFRFRIPGWATTCELSGGGDEAKRVENFYCIRKTWQMGDSVVLSLGCDVEPVVACNGEVGVQRGPLLYALPIAGKQTVLKEYDVAGFADIAVTPAGEIPEYYIDPETLSFVKQLLPDGDCLRPWHSSPVAVSGKVSNSNGIEETISLVPFGCTVLRQTTFKTDKKWRS